MTVGFDRISDVLESNLRHPAEGYQPINLERLEYDRYRITIAVVGFRRKVVEITSNGNILLVKGDRAQTAASKSKYLPVDVTARSFERQFELADFIPVKSADLADSLLTAELWHERPDAIKPRTTDIGTAKPTIESEATDDKTSTA